MTVAYVTEERDTAITLPWAARDRHGARAKLGGSSS